MFKKLSICILVYFLLDISIHSNLTYAYVLNGNNKFISIYQQNLNSPKKINSTMEVKLTNNSKYGMILTDGTGRTLYIFAKDTTTATCNGSCANIWPAFYADSLTIGSGLDDHDFGTITRADSTKQTTYKGWPLYYYSGDSAPGDVNGEGFFGVWFVAKPNYTIMLMNNLLVGGNGVEYDSSYQPGTGIVQFFVDSYGRTLYYFTKDSFDKNTFTNPSFSDSTLWKIYRDSAKAFPKGIDSSNFGTINVYGETQLTYKGWPLYEFAADSSKRGNTKGVSFPSPGIWPVAKASIKGAITGVSVDNPSAGLPHQYSLSQNYPDPFNPSTVISYSLPVSSYVTIKVFNLLGKEVATLVKGNEQAGNYRINFNANGLSSGVYFYSLITNSGMHFVKKMILLK